MHRRFVYVVAFFWPVLSAIAQEPVADLSGLWVYERPSSRCRAGWFRVPARKDITEVTQSGNSFNIRSYENIELNGQRFRSSRRPVYTTSDTWLPDGNTNPASVINDLNRRGIVLRINGTVSEDFNTITGTSQSFCFRENGTRVTDGPFLYSVPFKMTRASISPAIVAVGSADDHRVISSFSLQDTIHIAAITSDNWPDRTIEARGVVWTDGRERTSLGSLTLTRSRQDPTMYLSRAITAHSAMVEDDTHGSRLSGGILQIWGRPGSSLTAEIDNAGTVEATLAAYFILEVILETTTALLLFALLAFLVERLTNGICLILGYLGFWRRNFERIPGATFEKNDRNHRNRRIFLFFLGIAIAVPLCVYFGFNIIDQLQLPAIDPLAEQIGTGLIAASGADPIREIVWGGDGSGGRFSFARSGPRNIHVEAHLVGPPGSTIHIAEEKKDETVDRKD